jgi:hypothetical protein
MKNAVYLLRKFAFKFPKFFRKSAPNAEGRLPKIWNWVLPLLLGLVFGWLCMVSVEVWLNGVNRRARPATMISVFSGTAKNVEMMNMNAFLMANPFKISPMSVPGDVSYSKQVSTPRAVPASPRKSVAAGSAVNLEQLIVVANPDTAEPGGVSQALIDSLMKNPFDEIGEKIRIHPASEEERLQIQWINRDSVLNQIGIQKNDVVISINGIPLQNIMDITNAINSLMNSERFDIVVMRNGSPTSLQHVVR